MFTIESLTQLIHGKLRDGEGKENNIINDFEYFPDFVNAETSAYISIKNKTWEKFHGRKTPMVDGNKRVPKNIKILGVIITEEYIEDLEHKIPQIIVGDSIEAMKEIGLKARLNYKNPLIAITGSMGKSSTRIMLKQALSDYEVLANRNNSNTRPVMLLYMCKLATNPDFAVLEVSLNALNSRGNTALGLQPDIAIITGVGAAHLSTLPRTEDVAYYKSRIFDGLNEDGYAIYNNDSYHPEYLRKRAAQNTQNIFTFSIDDKKSDFVPKEIEYHKGYTTVKISHEENLYEYDLSSLSPGMVSNSLAVFSTLVKLGLNPNDCMKHLMEFNPFKKVLEMKELATPNYKVTVIDDTHNASLPAMINAIEAFNTQTKFFTGNKIIAIGQISDMGRQSVMVHDQLIEVLEKSNADYILCLDQPLRRVVSKVKGKKITWFADKELLMQHLLFLSNEDSLVLLKSSGGGTEFPKIALDLPNKLSKFDVIPTEDIYEGINLYGKAKLLLDENDKIIQKHNMENSTTIEGIQPLLYFIKAKETFKEDYQLALRNWFSNDKEYYAGKEMSLFELIDSMRNNPHPSLIIELSALLFKTDGDRVRYFNEMREKLNLSPSSTLNVTGRFRDVERQGFDISDLVNIYENYKDILFDSNHKEFVLGKLKKSGIIKIDNGVTIFTSYDDENELF